MEPIQVKIRLVREAVVTLDPEKYPEEMRTVEGMIECEKENAQENFDYMDMLEASEDFTFELIEE